MRIVARKIVGSLLIWIGVSALVGGGLCSGTLQEVENRTWDARVRVVARPEAHNKKIKIIAVDQSSLDRFAQHEKIFWPWPRSLYNPVLLFLQKAGAKAVAFDLLFTENSSQVEDDREFAATVDQSIPVVSAVALQRSGAPLIDEALRQIQSRQEKQREFIDAFLSADAGQRYSAAALPFPELLAVSEFLGSVTAQADSDQIFRRTWPGAFLNQVPILSLPFALYQAAGGTTARAAEVRSARLDDGSSLVRFFGPAGTYETFSVQAIIESWVRISEGRSPIVPLEEFADAIVLIGTIFPGHFDLRPVPFVGHFPGVEFNATVLDNLIGNSFIREVPVEVSAGIASVLILCVALGSLMRLLRQVLLAAALAFGWVAVCFYLASAGLWMPLVWPVIGILATTALVLAHGYQLEGRQHLFIKRAFRHYVSPEVIDQIVANPESLAIGGDRRELTIFFSDIEGFTSLSEKLDPTQLVRLLNRFLSEVSAIVLANGGTIDKYQGDAVIAFWNAPLPVADHARKAINAAIACHHKMKELERSFIAECGVPIRMRIGLHTGVVSVGNFGSSSRFNYTMIGDAANLASRLEGVNKVFGSYVAVSEATKEAASSVACRKLGEVRVVGRNTVVGVYEPLEVSGVTAEDASRYAQALQLFEQGDLSEARKIFAALSTDPVSIRYCERIDSSEGGRQVEAVWNLTAK